MKIIRISALWCSSCLVTYKYLEKLKEKYNDIEFVELDYDFDDIKKYNITSILPVVILEKDGVEIIRKEGENDLCEIEKYLEN